MKLVNSENALIKGENSEGEGRHVFLDVIQKKELKEAYQKRLDEDKTESVIVMKFKYKGEKIHSDDIYKDLKIPLGISSMIDLKKIITISFDKDPLKNLPNLKSGVVKIEGENKLAVAKKML